MALQRSVVFEGELGHCRNPRYRELPSLSTVSPVGPHKEAALAVLAGDNRVVAVVNAKIALPNHNIRGTITGSFSSAFRRRIQEK